MHQALQQLLGEWVSAEDQPSSDNERTNRWSLLLHAFMDSRSGLEKEVLKAELPELTQAANKVLVALRARDYLAEAIQSLRRQVSEALSERDLQSVAAQLRSLRNQQVQVVF